MGRFNNKTTSSIKTTNLAGGKAYKLNPQNELIHAVLTTFLEDKYYESGDERIERIRTLIQQNEPQFVANLAVIARLEFNLRSVSHLLIGELSKIHKGDSLIKDTMIAACIRPDDLTEIVSYVGTPIPKQVKRGVRNALLKFNRYQLAKYKNEGKSVSLVDLFNLCHPKVQHANDEQKEAWKDLIEGKLASFATWETVISNTPKTEHTAAWTKLVQENKLGYMALLRNLNNLIENNVDDETIDMVVKKLTNPDEVRRSKQLPYRFFTAYTTVQGNRKLTDAISIAMDIAVENTPRLEGKTLIAIDTSGSMKGDALTKASLFGATLLKANTEADVMLYDTEVQHPILSSRLPVIDLAQKIQTAAGGGGTMTSLVFTESLSKKKVYDRIIIISDNESWSDEAVQPYYEAYKRRLDSNPFVYAIDIQGYGTTDITGGRVKHLTGWAGRLLDFVAQAEKGETLIEYVTNYHVKG